MTELPYRRDRAVAYARRWALKRNPAYYNFDELGGDCTNFVSQCLYAGAAVMNETPVTGWFYFSASRRTASWTGVEFLHQFLVWNRSVGPYASETERAGLEPGDVVQLRDMSGPWSHSLLVTETQPEIRIAAHSSDARDRLLRSYDYAVARYLHIEGVRDW